MAFKLKSADFKDHGKVPSGFTAQGGSINPRLQWSGAPEGTRELALLCEDPDAPFPKPFTHWVVYGLSPNVGVVPAGLAPQERLELPVLAMQGRNSLGRVGFTGPNPPFWHGSHRYIFRLFALSRESNLPPGAGREEFLKAIAGKVIDEARLTGLYEKPLSAKLRAASWWAAGIAGVALLFRRPRRVR
jgi:Raf kinase inhibitor-like YbhB/YbcL family protein